MSQGNYKLYGCPNCSGNKNPKSNTYANYKVSIDDTIIRIVCRKCKYAERFRMIRGGI